MNALGILPGISATYKAIGLKNTTGKVLVPTPTFGYYFQQFEDEGIDFETLPSGLADGFLPDPEKLEFAIKRTGAKALLLCYPNNPTGVVMTEERAREIADITKRHGVFVISDEVFLNNILGEKKHFSIAAIPGMVDRSVTFTSISKAVGLSRFRMAFCVGARDIVESYAILEGHSIGDQMTIVTAIESSEKNLLLKENKLAYLFNIQLIKEAAATLNKKFCEIFGEEKVGDEAYVKPYIPDPEAGNVYLLDFSGLRGKIRNGKPMGTGLDVAEWLLEDASVGTAPGECYMFHPEEMLVRIALGHPGREIEQAFKRIMHAAERVSKAPSKSPTSPILTIKDHVHDSGRA
jgi:aspartate/methionine/tyrosine aminotransferase